MVLTRHKRKSAGADIVSEVSTVQVSLTRMPLGKNKKHGQMKEPGGWR